MLYLSKTSDKQSDFCSDHGWTDYVLANISPMEEHQRKAEHPEAQNVFVEVASAMKLGESGRVRANSGNVSVQIYRIRLSHC